MANVTVRDMAYLAVDAYRGSDSRGVPAGFERINGIPEIARLENNLGTGFQANVYRGPNGEIVIAFAGTNDRISKY